MNDTEKIYWENGFQVRGKNFYSLALSIFNLGILICVWGNKKLLIPRFYFYKLK